MITKKTEPMFKRIIPGLRFIFTGKLYNHRPYRCWKIPSQTCTGNPGDVD